MAMFGSLGVSYSGMDVYRTWIDATADNVFDKFRTKYAGAAEGAPLPFKVERDGQVMTVSGTIRFATIRQQRLTFAENPSARALRVRQGILTGTTAR